MQGLKSYCWQLEPFGWPCLTQSEWASWIQVIAAIAGIALALYIPVRMKRLEDLDQMRSVVARLAGLRAIADGFKAKFTPDASITFPPKAEIETARSACEALVLDVATDAAFIPALASALEQSRVMLTIWVNVASSRATDSDSKNAAETVHVQIVNAHQSAEDVLRKWKRKHRFAILFHG